MPRIPRWAAWSAALLLVVGLAAALASLLGRDRVRLELEDRLSAALGREVSIAGPVHLVLQPTPRLDVAGLRVAGAGGPLLEIGRVAVEVDVAALAAGRVALGTVRIERPRLRLAVDAAGRGNWEPLAPTAAAPAGPAPEWSVRRLEIVDGRVDWQDARDGTSASLEGLSVVAGPVSVPGEVLFDLRIEGAQYGAARLRAAARGALAIDPGADEYGGRDLALELVPEKIPGWPALAQQTVRVVVNSLTASGRDGRARIEGLRASGLGLDVRLDGEARLAEAPGPAFGGRMRVAPFSPREVYEALGRELPTTQDPTALSRAALDARVEWGGGEFRFRELDARLDDSRLRGAVTVGLGTAPSWRFDLAIDRLDAERYREPEALRHDAPVELPVEFLRELDAVGVLAFDELRVGGTRLTGVRVQLDGESRAR
ncbi:MAG: AsmA family protein [Steroidobacteraceae bacterium]|nr:AsmA family protein [Steroidobacteraceae bacterium]